VSTTRIMIVEDDKAIRESLTAHLDDCGFHSMAMPDATTALNALESAPVDAIIVDLRLPDMNGEEFIRLAHARRPHVVFMIYTGSLRYKLPDDLAHIEEVSERVFLKPLDDLDVLTTEIHRLLEARKTRHENDHHPDHR
jgi:DNA-binding NtrC family response regulator